MRVTFARDMKVDEAMATPLQERLYASHAPHYPSLYLLLPRRDVALEKDAAGCTSPPLPLRRLSRAKCNKAATFT